MLPFCQRAIIGSRDSGNGARGLLPGSGRRGSVAFTISARNACVCICVRKCVSRFDLDLTIWRERKRYFNKQRRRKKERGQNKPLFLHKNGIKQGCEHQCVCVSLGESCAKINTPFYAHTYIPLTHGCGQL